MNKLDVLKCLESIKAKEDCQFMIVVNGGKITKVIKKTVVMQDIVK